jgi:hypothetical protein
LVEGDSASFDDLGTSENTAVALGANEVSNSYGGTEFNGSTDYAADYAHPGVAIVASSGDAGYGIANTPAAYQSVVAVGGTSLTKANNARGWTETAWAGASSGCSAWIDKPAWQSDPNCPGRMVADVAADADPNTGPAVYDAFDGYQWLVVGGTSASSPFIAGVIGLAGNPGQYPNASYFYPHAAQLNDVTSGNNSASEDCGGDYQCNAVPGYDGPTGLGTPNGIGAFTANGLASATSLVATPNPATVGSQVTLIAAVTGTGATPTGTVTFSDGTDALGTATVDAAGHAVLSIATLAAGHHPITAAYAGDASYNPSTSAAQDESVNPASAAKGTTAASTKTSSKSGGASISAAAGSQLLSCAGAQVALVDAVPQGNVVRISGVASAAYVGKTVQVALTSPHKVVASTPVRKGGAFQTLAKLPGKSSVARASYTATVAGRTSAPLKLQRRAYLTKVRAAHGRLTIHGMVTGAFRKGAVVRVEELTRCTVPLRVANARLSAGGKWNVTVLFTGDPSGVLFRARTTVLTGKRSSTIVTVPHPVTG